MRRAGMLHRGGRVEAVSKEDTAREANEDAAFRRKQMPAPVFEMGSGAHLAFTTKPSFGIASHSSGPLITRSQSPAFLR